MDRGQRRAAVRRTHLVPECRGVRDHRHRPRRDVAGPDVTGLTAAAAATSIPVIASGGVATIDDVIELGRVPGIAGVITGKALYEGRFTVADGVAALAKGAGS
ncbi:MAG: HisA/HisF-related TIM barrel protein [Ilumatobacteraceae bacterium]